MKLHHLLLGIAALVLTVSPALAAGSSDSSSSGSDTSGQGASSSAPAEATSSLVDAADPSSVVSAFQSAGYRAALKTGSDGDPYILTSMSGRDVYVYFYNCADHKNCDTVDLVTSYSVDKPPSAADMNRWNNTKLFGRAYLDDKNNPAIDMSVRTKGGMTEDNFESNVLMFDSVLGSFKDFINP